MTTEIHTIITLSHKDIIDLLRSRLNVPDGAEMSAEFRFGEAEHLINELIDIRIDYKHKE